MLSPSGTHLCAMTYQQNGAQLETILQFFDLTPIRCAQALTSVRLSVMP